MTDQSDRHIGPDNVVCEIVAVLEEQGVARDAYQLYDVVDPDALQQVCASGADVSVTFTVQDVHIRVTPDAVVATENASETV